MSSNIILNKNHIFGNNNNKLEYVFPQPISFNSEKDKPKIALSQLHIYNSWYNVNSSMYNNHKFSYKWWDMNGDLTETHDVLLPNGSYSVADIYEFLQKTMFDRGHCLISIDGSKVMYLIEIVTNSTYYAIEIRMSSISTTLDGSPYTDSWQVPSSWTIPSTYQTPELIFSSNSSFQKLLGFKSQTMYKDLTVQPTSNQIYSFLSDDGAPAISPSSSYLVTCSMCENKYSVPNNILTSFTSSVAFGDMISIGSADTIYSHIKSGTYQSVTIELYDQNFVPLQILDKDMLIILSIVEN